MTPPGRVAPARRWRARARARGRPLELRRTAAARAGWSVRAQVSAIGLAVLVLFTVILAVSSVTTLRSARRAAERSTATVAGTAARAVAASVALGEAQVAAVSTNPGVPPLLTSPTAPDCPIQFVLELLPGSRVDVVRPDGTVVCSSDPSLVGTSHAGSDWHTRMQQAPQAVRTGGDDGRGGAALVSAAPVVVPGPAVVGAAAMVVPARGIATQLRAAIGGSQPHRFGLVDRETGAALSADPSLDVTAPDDGGVIAAGDPIGDTAWQAVAGIDEDDALGPARSTILRAGAPSAAVLVLLLVALAILNRRIARPLRHLTEAVRGGRLHADVALAAIEGPQEIVRLAEEFRAAGAAREAYERRLAHQSLHDPLTALPNRALLAELLAHSLQRAARTERAVAVLFVDVDRFKLVNDVLGHAAGDEVLVALARRLRDELRPADTLARFGGDEFVVVAEGLEHLAQAERLAGRLLDAVAEPIQTADRVVRASASIGIAVGDASSDGAHLVRDADTAMTRAKDGGGGGYRVFDGRLGDEVSTRLTIESEPRTALARDDFRLVYQPKIDLATGAVTGVEALLRWDHPALGAVPPASFIPIAEETGLIVDIGRFVLDDACRQAAAWRRDGFDVPMAVNVSGRQLVEPSLVPDVVATLDRHDLDAPGLCLELTESVLMQDAEQAAETLAALRAVGVQLSIDDFGTGYSSLAYLHRFAVDELKIDRIFVQGVGDHAEVRTLVNAVVAMGHALGLRVVAEGVETIGQADDVRALGCHSAQGFLYSVPEPPERLRPFLERTIDLRTSALAVASPDDRPW